MSPEKWTPIMALEPKWGGVVCLFVCDIRGVRSTNRLAAHTYRQQGAPPPSLFEVRDGPRGLLQGLFAAQRAR